jgi:hypothetical protein
MGHKFERQTTGRIKRMEAQKRALRERVKFRTPSQVVRRLFKQRQRTAISVENVGLCFWRSEPNGND